LLKGSAQHKERRIMEACLSNQKIKGVETSCPCFFQLSWCSVIYQEEQPEEWLSTEKNTDIMGIKTVDSVDDSDSCAPANDPCKDYISDYSEFYKTNI
jgi:hypothetical protein